MIADKYFAEVFRVEIKSRGRGVQASVARALGVDRSKLNNSLKGRRPLPEDVRIKIAKELGMDYWQMYRKFIEENERMTDKMIERGQEGDILIPGEDLSPVLAYVMARGNHFHTVGIVAYK